jgi:chaperonin GroES
MAKIKPTSKNVLVESLTEASKDSATKSGIIIPESIDSEKGGTEQGVVVETGPKVKAVKKGQKIIFSKYGNEEIKAGNKKYFIVSEDNLLAIIE